MGFCRGNGRYSFMTTKRLLLSLSLITAFIVGVASLFFLFYAPKPTYQKVVFSEKLYPRERNLIRKYLEKELGPINS